MLRHFLLGLGVALILIFIILVTFNLELVNLAELDEEFIVEQVREKELEKTFIDEAKKEVEAEIREEYTNENLEEMITEEYIIDKAKKLGMSFDNQLTDEFISQYYFTKGSFFSETDFLESDITDDGMDTEEIEKDNEKETIKLFIRSGMNAREIAWLLKEEGLISDVTSFILLVNRFDMEDKIMAGTYHFSPDISTLRLLLEMTI